MPCERLTRPAPTRYVLQGLTTKGEPVNVIFLGLLAVIALLAVLAVVGLVVLVVWLVRRSSNAPQVPASRAPDAES